MSIFSSFLVCWSVFFLCSVSSGLLDFIWITWFWIIQIFLIRVPGFFLFCLFKRHLSVLQETGQINLFCSKDVLPTRRSYILRNVLLSLKEVDIFTLHIAVTCQCLKRRKKKRFSQMLSWRPYFLDVYDIKHPACVECYFRDPVHVTWITDLFTCLLYNPYSDQPVCTYSILWRMLDTWSIMGWWHIIWQNKQASETITVPVSDSLVMAHYPFIGLHKRRLGDELCCNSENFHYSTNAKTRIIQMQITQDRSFSLIPVFSSSDGHSGVLLKRNLDDQFKWEIDRLAFFIKHLFYV